MAFYRHAKSLRNLKGKRPTFAIHFRDGGIGTGRPSEEDESVALGDARPFVDEQLDARDLAELAESVLEGRLVEGSGKLVHVNVALVIVA